MTSVAASITPAATSSVRNTLLLQTTVALILSLAIGLYFWHGLPGYEQLGFIAVVAGGGYAMFRVWRGRHSYS